MWHGKAKRILVELGSPADPNPVSKLPAVQDLVKNKRALAVLDMAWLSTPPGQRHRLLVDISQDIGRRPWTTGPLGTLCTSSDIFLMFRLSCLMPCEKFKLLGFGTLDLQWLSNSALSDLAGDAMSVISVGMMLLAVWLAQPS